MRTDLMIAQGENGHLREDLKKLKAEVASLKSPTGHPIFLFSWISPKDDFVSDFTGMPNSGTFHALLRMFEGVHLNYFKGWNVTRLSRCEQLFMTLLKLLRGLTHEDLAVRFGVDASTVSNVFKTWLFALHKMLVKNMMKKIPSRFKNQKSLPDVFKPKYENTRMVLDCTEVWTANPSLISNQNMLFSTYKNRITLKGLVAVAPDGTVIYISLLYPGRISDKEIVAHCKILEHCEPGDQVMADKGFLIFSLLPAGVTLNIPPSRKRPSLRQSRLLKLPLLLAPEFISRERYKELNFPKF